MADLYHSPIIYQKTYTWPPGMTNEETLSRIRERVELEDPMFMVLLSMYLASTSDCKKDLALSEEWLLKGLAYEHADVYCLAGMSYLYGYFGKKDPEKAMFFFDAAEKICRIKGLYCKGYLNLVKYLSDRTNENAYREAGKFFRKAAKQGHATSLYMYLYCASKNPIVRCAKLYSAALLYLVRRLKLSGPQRWWCYRDLKQFRPSTVKFAENCGHALGYFAKKQPSP